MVAIPKLLLLWTVVFFLVWTFLLLVKPKYIMGIIEKIVKNSELSFLFGLVLLVISFLYLLVYAKLDGTWYMLFSILGYLYALKGIVMMCFPKFGMDRSKLFYGKVSSTRIMGIVLLCITIFLFCTALVKF